MPAWPYEFDEVAVREVHHTLTSTGVPVTLTDVVEALRGHYASVQSTTAAMEAWSQAQWASLTQAYLTEHRRLPGSSRTARLRKKRYHRILSWYDQRPPQKP